MTVGNAALGGQFSVVNCALELDDGDGFVPVGPEMYTESPGNSSHDEAYNVALVAGADRPAGTYDARIACFEFNRSLSSDPIARAAGLSVVAMAR